MYSLTPGLPCLLTGFVVDMALPLCRTKGYSSQTYVIPATPLFVPGGAELAAELACSEEGGGGDTLVAHPLVQAQLRALLRWETLAGGGGMGGVAHGSVGCCCRATAFSVAATNLPQHPFTAAITLPLHRAGPAASTQSKRRRRRQRLRLLRKLMAPAAAALLPWTQRPPARVQQQGLLPARRERERERERERQWR